ncbi:polymerase delta 4 [Tasmannia lanceolata]|uniref:polymerase delta 4 n=1 Tax=Tasmannia lanceolata TaxID=3420 RepID=UPI004062F775
MASGDIKGFYRQRKSAKTPSKSKPSNSKKSSLSLGSDPAQSPVLVSHASFDLQDDFDKHEEVLRQFDMNMSYGPCLGLSRMERWERANNLGLKPPKDVEILLKGGNVGLESLWDGRV